MQFSSHPLEAMASLHERQCIVEHIVSNRTIDFLLAPTSRENPNNILDDERWLRRETWQVRLHEDFFKEEFSPIFWRRERDLLIIRLDVQVGWCIKAFLAHVDLFQEYLQLTSNFLVMRSFLTTSIEGLQASSNEPKTAQRTEFWPGRSENHPPLFD